MIWWHRVGQKVVCIDAGPLPYPSMYPYEYRRLKQGSTYTITHVGLDNLKEHVCFHLAEISHARSSGWLHKRFQPVRDTSIESLRELLNPTPEQKREVFQEMIEEKQRELVR